jgi:hypothetical protein
MASKRDKMLADIARKYGYFVTTGGRHHRLRPIPPRTGPVVTASISPKNEVHWLRHVERDLQKAVKSNC